MGLVDALKSMLGLGGGGSSGAVDRGLYWYVRCNRCQDVVRVRVNMANEVSEISDEPEDDPDVSRPSNPAARYAVTKGVVDSKCFRPMRLTILFDGRRRELESSVGGGEIVDEAAWEAARASRQPPESPPA
ncbi:MAG TPA: hypothetical protein VFH48_38635 [Chloroflexota bacterium]|nr:hypothetical protein [Chloroflexota bacterium]